MLPKNKKFSYFNQNIQCVEQLLANALNLNILGECIKRKKCCGERLDLLHGKLGAWEV